MRPLSRDQLQMFFDHAHDLVDQACSSEQKGCQTLFGEAALFQGHLCMRAAPARAHMLDLSGFTRNPQGWELGRRGVCSVR